jgi:hypothetical protein
MNLGILKLYSLFFFLMVSLNGAINIKDNFTLVKKGLSDNNTLLIVGGIQGDEPGGFIAASLIATHYNIKCGSVWVVPNLNFDSIINRSRGRFGDMNRKFIEIPKSDPDYENVENIKKLIKHDDVKLIVNLHDGSGFFRKKYIDKLHSPHKWGQSSIIDQSILAKAKYKNLKDISSKVVKHINNNLLDEEHRYGLKNTYTKNKDKEMAKTLTFYAINHNKAAFGNEASKALPTHERTYYHLLAIEKYMNVMGIEFKRDFELTPKVLKNVIDNDISIAFYNNKIKLPLAKVRRIIRYFPTSQDLLDTYTTSNPLMKLIKKDNCFEIRYGNRRISTLYPDNLIMEQNNNHQEIEIVVDNKATKKIPLGSIVEAKNSFSIEPNKNIRVNIIGYINKKSRDEAGFKIKKDSILKRFSIDKDGNIFRVEFYNTKDNFLGTVIIDFRKKQNKFARHILTKR